MVTTGMLVLIVATGATVRLTGSGLGCEHWPGCQPGDPFPARGYHSDIEFSNRVVAFLTVLTTLGLGIGAFRTPGLGRGAKILAALVFAGTLAQAPLGAITVYYHLNPWLVISHLLLSLVVLGLGVLVLLEASRLVRGGDGPLPALARAGGAVAARGDRRPRRLRDARDRGRQVPGQQRRHARAPARLVRAVGRAARPRRRRVRDRLPPAGGVGLAQPRAVPVADPRLRGAARDPRACR